MTTVSVPLNAEFEKYVESLVIAGFGSNKADAIRRAIKAAAEEQAIQAVLRSASEPTLSGDIKDLANKII